MSVDPSSIIGWYEKVHEQLSDFKPEARSMEVNFAQRLTLMHVQIAVPDGMRRSLTKVKIPAYPGYRITGMIDEAFVEHNHLWRHDGDNYVLKASDLPASSRYRVTMEGSIDERVLRAGIRQARHKPGPRREKRQVLARVQPEDPRAPSADVRRP